jgi:hypothetical protein
MIIKVILIAGTLVLGFIALRQRASGTTLAIRRLGGVGIIVVGTVLVLWPNTTTRVANAVGVGRGTDLLLYGLVMAFMFTTISIHQKLYVLEQRVTSLVRELALLEAARSENQDPDE